MSDRERSRTYSWEDPTTGAGASREMSGLDYLQQIAAGRLPPPPMALTMGMEFTEMGPGTARFAVVPGEHHYNPIGTIHGGLVLTMIDSAASSAVHTTLPAGVGYTTLEVKVNFVRPITVATGRLIAEGTVVHGGRTVATAEARISDGAGKLYAHGTATCLIVR